MKRRRQLCWFFTNRQLLMMVILFCLGMVLQVMNVTVNLQFLSAQKAVQNGDLTKWKLYLVTLLVLSVFSVTQEVFMCGFNNTLKRYVQFNLFKRYQRCFKVHEKGVLMRMNVILAELVMPLSVFSAIMGIYTIVKTMEMVTFSMSNIIVAVILLLSAMICGVLRGKCESSKKEIEATIAEKKSDLTKFDSFSSFFLDSSLYVLDIEYKYSGRQSIKKVFFENLPRTLKQVLYVFLVWGLVNSIAADELYSESYLILTAYGTVLSIAEQLGKLAEKTIEIHQMRKNSDVKALDEFEAKEKSQIILNREYVTLSDDGVEIDSLFSLDVKAANGEERRYALTKPVKIHKGHHALLQGPKESGKTRLLSFIRILFPDNVMVYNDNSKIFAKFRDNFKTEFGFDANLIRELAAGLKLERFANLSDNELRKLQITNINTGDKHLCVALLMLYFAIKDPNSAKLIVFDELLANVDAGNSREILKFIMKKVDEIGSTVIFVGHSQQELIKKYCSSVIQLEPECYEVKVSQEMT